MDIRQLDKKEAWELIFEVLKTNKTADENAKEVADALMNAEIDGKKGHGISRLPTYVEQLIAQKVDGMAIPSVVSEKANVIEIDAKHGFAFPALSLAIKKLNKISLNYGITIASIAHSHHFGQAGYHVERLANAGFIALMLGNSPKAIAPWGGSKPLFGTNPIAFSAPRHKKIPVVIDLSLSRVARGKIILAKQKNELIPDDWAIDKGGKVTTNPDDALSGSMLPIGGAKGSVLALMIEILVAGLTNSNFGFEASSFFDAEGKPPNVGQLLITMNPKFFSGGNFDNRIEAIITEMLKQSSVRLPSEGRFKKRQNTKTITIANSLYEQIIKLR